MCHRREKGHSPERARVMYFWRAKPRADKNDLRLYEVPYKKKTGKIAEHSSKTRGNLFKLIVPFFEVIEYRALLPT
jgi:hypothetical protein